MWAEVLKMLADTRDLVDIRRSPARVSDTRGFVLAVSEERVLVAVISDDVLPSGFSVLRLEDITLVRWGRGKLKAWQAALAPLMDDFVWRPQVDLTDWESVITSAARAACIVTLFRENLDSDMCYIGRNLQIESGVVRAEEISTEGALDGHFALLVRDLTRVDYGGSYEKALLACLAGGRRKAGGRVSLCNRHAFAAGGSTADGHRAARSMLSQQRESMAPAESAPVWGTPGGAFVSPDGAAECSRWWSGAAALRPDA